MPSVNLTDHAEQRQCARGIATHRIRKAIRPRRYVGEGRNDTKLYRYHDVIVVAAKDSGEIVTTYRKEGEKS